MTRCVLAPAVITFIEKHPNVAVQVVEGYSGVLTRQVADGDLAFAIVPAFSETAGLRSRMLIRTPELLVSKKTPQNGNATREVRLADLPGSSWSCLERATFAGICSIVISSQMVCTSNASLNWMQCLARSASCCTRIGKRFCRRS